MIIGTVGADLLLPTDGGIKVYVDWDATDLYGYTDDVTSRVRVAASPVTVEYGRDQSTALAPTVAGRGGFTLDNRDGRYSSHNQSSPLYGLIRPARPVRVTRQIGSTLYQLFVGHTDDSPVNPDIDADTVALSLVDALADLRTQHITTGLYRDIRTGDAVRNILTAAGWDMSLVDIDLGATVIPWWWEDNTDALTALDKVLRSEGPPALLTIGGNGTIVFRDRHHRLTRTQSNTVQSTWRASGPLEPFMQKGFTYNEAWDQIVNEATVSVDVRTLGPVGVVWQSDSTITLSAGEQKMITVTADNPFLNGIDPVDGVDFTTLSGSVTCRLLRNSGASTPVIITAGNTPAAISNLQVRGQAVTVAYTMQVSDSDAVSISDYGRRSFQGDLPWCGVEDARDVLNLIVSSRSAPLPILSVRFVIGNNFPRAQSVLDRDIGDRVTVIEPRTALNHDFFIESIRHEFTSEYDHTVVFGLEMCGNAFNHSVLPPLPVFRLDTPGAGLDLGHLGKGINDDGITAVFLLDVSGQGLNQGALAA